MSTTINSLDNFTIIGGNDFTFKFPITDEDGVPVDLTGSTLLLKIAPYGQANNVITTITGSIGDTTDIAEFILPSATSEQLVGGKYMYQPIIQDTGGTIHRPKQGTFLLIQAIGAFSDVIEVPEAVYYIYGQGTNTYTSTNTTITTYYAGLSIVLYVQNTNSANSTLELSGVVGTKNLMKFDTSGNKVVLVAGDLLINKKYLFTYDGIEWVLVGTPRSDGLVTNGDSHDHNGGDGAQISHLNLSNIGTNTHAQIDTFIGTTVPTTYAPLASPTFTGDPKAPTASVGDNDTSIATTAFVNAEISNDRPYSDTNPLMDGTAAQGSSARISRQDHVHPTDTSRAPAVITTSVQSVTTTNITADQLTSYFLDISGLTANRNFVLPAPSGAGRICRVQISVGDDTYKLGIIGNTGVTINGGTAATLWRYLQRKGEAVSFISTSTTNWAVMSSQINETSSAYCSATALTQAITASIWTKVTTVFNTSKDQQEWWSDANKRFTLPEGKYIVSGHVVVSDLADQSIFIAMIYKNGSQEVILGRTTNSGTGLAGTGGTAQIESDGDDYFEIYVFVGDDATVTSNSIMGYCHFDIAMSSP